MEHLPIELRRAILQHLPLRDLKRIRLASKHWALLGEDYLMPSSFTSLPHRPDTARLHNIALHPTYARQIQSLTLNHGEVSEYSARHNSYFLQYLMEPEARLEQQYQMWEAYAIFRQLKEKYLPGSCDEALLTDIFSRLPNLREINVTLMTCPFPRGDPRSQHVLKDIWAFPSTRLLNRVATVERMTSVLRAVSANAATLQLSSLAHDRLPFEFFAQPRSHIAQTHESKLQPIASVFVNLTSVSLALEYSDMPNNMHADLAFANLARCLRNAPLLQRLELAMLGRRKIDIQPLLDAFSSSSADSSSSPSSVSSSSSEEGAHVFRCLELVALQGVLSTEEALGSFLVQQGGNGRLASVQLGGEGVRSVRQPCCGGVVLEQGSWAGLAARLAREMRGVDVRVQGDCRGLESGERWDLEGALAIAEVVGGLGNGT